MERFYKAVDSSFQEQLEDEYGEYKVTTEVTRTKDISVKKALEDCAVWVKILERDINFDTDSISDACVVTAKAKSPARTRSNAQRSTSMW